MPTRTGNIHFLRQRVVESAKRATPHLVGSELGEAGVLDRAVLNRELAEILEGVADQLDLATRIERSIQGFLRAMQTDNVARTAKHVCALLSLELDDLRKAALLSLMVRMAGKRKFDPIAAYILQNQKVLVTRRG
ncbi:MAG TPA: hypothetical protein VFW44_09105 [Bryobacteraceae bacterium]|nr:hypothetical protein [Bryobacteraceae bacterium]